MVEDQISENFEQTQSLNLDQLHSISLRSKKKTQLEEYSMVVIRDAQNHNNDCSVVFPPINHENLQIPSHSFQQHCEFPDSPSSSSSSLYSSSSPPSPSSYSDTPVLFPSPASDSRLRKSGDFAGWMSIGFQILRSKGFALVTSFRNYVANRGAIWSIGSAAASFVISWWMCLQFFRWMRRRRQIHVENHLTAIIKRKDERIAKLLQQIAQMNEILATHHKA